MKREINPRKSSDVIAENTESKYINLMTDYGLKSLLKSEELAIQFLNLILNGATNIKKIKYLDKESMGKSKYQRTAIFDLLCEDDQNREFIIEMQRVKQEFFEDRALYYTASRLQENAPKGKLAFRKWNFQQKPLFFIGLLDFEYTKGRPNKFMTIVQLCDIEEFKVFYNKLTYIYLELPKFAKSSLHKAMNELTDLGKWLFTIKNLHEINELPDFLNEAQFQKILEIAELAKMTKVQRRQYDLSLKQMQNEYSIKETWRKEGFKEGVEETETRKNIEIINRLLNEKTIPVSKIAELVGVDEAYVLEIKNAMPQK